MADFLINAGVVFSPKDIDTSAIRKKIAETTANTTVKLAKFTVSKVKLRLGIKAALENMSFTLNLKDVNVNTGAIKAKLQGVIDEVNRKATINPKVGKKGDRGPEGQFITKGKDIQATTKALDEVRRAAGLTGQSISGLSKFVDTLNNKNLTAGEKLLLLKERLQLTAQASEKSKQGFKGITLAAGQSGASVAAGARKMKLFEVAISTATRKAREFKVSADGISTATKKLAKFRGLAFMNPKEIERWKALNAEVKKHRQLQSDQATQLRSSAQDISNVSKNQNELNRLYTQGGANAEIFGANLGKIIQRFSTYLIAIKLIIAAQQAFNFAIGSIVEFDDALQDLRKVLTVTPQQLANITKELFEVGRQTGASFSQMAESYNEIVRQGLKADEALGRLKATMIAVAITELDVTEATNFMTATMKIFGDEVRDEIEALDILSLTADETAASATEIAQSFVRSGAAAKAVGVSYRELAAITAATVEQTKISAQTIGAALKTIFSRIVTNTKGIRDQANAWGASVTAADSVFEILRKLSGVYKTLDKSQRGQLSYLVAGRRRFTELAGILQSFGDTQVLLEKQMNSAGTAAAKQEREMEKFSTQAKLMGNAWKEFIIVLSGGDTGAAGPSQLRESLESMFLVMGGLAQGASAFLRALNQAKDVVTPLLSVFKGIAKVAFFTVGVTIIRQMIHGFRQMVQLGSLWKQVLAAIGGQQSVIHKSITAQDLEAKKLLNTERKRLGTSRAIAKSAQESLTAYARASRADRDLDKSAATGRNKFRQALILTAGIQVVSDQFKSLAKTLKASNSELEKMVGGMLEAGTSALDLGVMFSLMGGPIAGSIAAIGSLTMSFLKAQASYIKTSSEQQKLVSNVRASAIGSREVAKAGEFVKQAFKETAREGKSTASTLIILERAVKLASDPLFGLGAQFEETGDSLNRIIKEVDSAIRAADITSQLVKFQEGFKADASEFEMRINAGQVGAEFKPVLRATADLQAKIQSIDPDIKTMAGSLALVNRAENAILELQKERGRSNKEIIEDYNLESQEVLKIQSAARLLEDSFDSIGDKIETQKENISGLEQQYQKLLTVSDGIRKSGEKDGARKTEAKRTAKDLENIGIEINKATEYKNKLDGQSTKLAAEKNRLVSAEAQATKRNVKAVLGLQFGYQNITNEIQKTILSLNVKTAAVNDNMTALRAEAKIQQDIAKIQESGRFGRGEEAQIKSLLGQRKRSIDELNAKETAQIENLSKRREDAHNNFEIIKRNDLDRQIQETRDAFAENRKAIIEKLDLEIVPKINAQARKAIERSENKLLDTRINLVNQAIETEQRLADKRIDFIREFGGTLLGKKALEGELRDIGDFAKKTFGEMGALQVKEQEKAAKNAVSAILYELQELEKRGADEALRLSQTVEARAKIQATSEELIGAKREAILDVVRKSSEDASEAEEQLISARNEIPALNAKIVDSEKSVGKSRANVTKATDGLRQAYQNAADATGQYKFEIQKAAFDIGVSTGSIGGAGSKIQELGRIYSSVTNEISLSQNKLLDLQKSISNEMLDVYRSQFEALKGIGISAATASGEELVKMAEGLNTAASILSGADVGSFSVEQLEEALNLSSLYPEIERTIAEFGLEKLGIDKSVLQGLEGQMLELAKISAETGKQQVDASHQQVASAQQSLAVAEEQLSQAQDALNIAVQQRDVQLQTTGVLQGQHVSQKNSYVQVQKHSARQLSILNDNLAANRSMDESLKVISDDIKSLVKSISDQASEMQKFADANSVPNAAAGSLTGSEARGVLSAARREKRLMPAGSNLMLANTSEVVLNRRQASSIGLAPVPKKFAADGNAQAAGLENAASTLSSAMGALLSRLNSPGFVNQNISVQVDTERKVNVTGLDAVEKTVKRATEERFGSFASKEEQEAINDTVVHIVEKLQEVGVVNSIGE